MERRLLQLRAHVTAAAAPEVRPFTLHVSEDELDDLKHRLKQTRWPDQLVAGANADWEYGAELGYLQKLAEYWRDTFDWRAAEARFNAMPQFITRVRGVYVGCGL